MQQNRQSEAGNVFMFILLGIVLFGALAFTIARGFRSDTTSSISERQAELAATDILNYAQQIERAVNRLRRNGCSENDISFENSYYPTSTVNASAPGDNSCHVFDSAGGKIKYLQILDDWILPVSAYPGVTFTTSHGHTAFIGSAKVTNLADNDEADVMLVIPWLKDGLCNKLNKILGTEGTNEFAVWHEQHLGPNQIRNSSGFINTKAVPRYCSEDNSQTTRTPNTFHYVILAR